MIFYGTLYTLKGVRLIMKTELADDMLETIDFYHHVL